MRNVILGTAGHIDHGKTTLVKALTGTDTDRLPEEKARGITIDLGFAHMQLDDLDVGIVDVPGHEGLVRNMLAGATGFDAVLLVIAADEGIMPQTREHFAIADLLGVERLVVAITKADTVDAEWLDLVRGEVQEFLTASSFAAGAPIVAVSAVSGTGIDDLRARLATELSRAAQRRSADVFRMPIDRVFTVRGTGTVVTGTVWSGRAAREDIIRILPGERTARIRAVQTHGAAVDAAIAGERAAFALAGVERDQLTRGDSLVIGAGWNATWRLTARVRLLDKTILKQRQRVRVHLGTSEVMARVVLLGDDWVQLRLEKPLVARGGDRFIMRSYSPVATIAGGVVAEVSRVRKRVNETELQLLGSIIDGDKPERVRAAIELSAFEGCRTDALPVAAGVSPQEAADAIASLGDAVLVLGSVCYAQRVLESVMEELVATVRGYHAEHPLNPGIERAELINNRLPRDLAESAMELAQQQRHLLKRGSVVAAADFTPNLSPKKQALREQLVAKLEAAGLAPPTVSELAQSLNSTDVRPVLRLLEGQGQVTSVATDLYLDAAVLSAAVHEVRGSLGGKRLAAADFRTALPVSRKYLIPLLEYLDRVGVTRREGDLRWVEPLETP